MSTNSIKYFCLLIDNVRKTEKPIRFISHSNEMANEFAFCEAACNVFGQDAFRDDHHICYDSFDYKLQYYSASFDYLFVNHQKHKDGWSVILDL